MVVVGGYLYSAGREHVTMWQIIREMRAKLAIISNWSHPAILEVFCSRKPRTKNMN